MQEETKQTNKGDGTKQVREDTHLWNLLACGGSIFITGAATEVTSTKPSGEGEAHIRAVTDWQRLNC